MVTAQDYLIKVNGNGLEFLDSETKLKLADDCPLVFSAYKNLSIFLYGNFYAANIKTKKILNKVLKNYKQGSIKNKIANLDGSFVLFIFDKENQKSVIITDRTASRKVFYCFHNNSIYLSNNIYFFKNLFNHSIDYGVLGFYLTNGYTVNNRSLLKDIHLLPYATILTMNGNDFKFEKYWDFYFHYSESDNNSHSNKHFHDLLLSSIEKRLKVNEKIIISLSGGFDSKTILGALREFKNNDEIVGFNYYYNKLPFSDKSEAAKLSRICSIKLYTIPIFKKNQLLSNINENIRLGMGLSNFCQEITGVKELHNLIGNHYTKLFSGDEVNGTNWSPGHSLNEDLSSLNINKVGSLLRKKEKLNLELINYILIESRKFYNDYLQTIPSFTNNFDRKHYIYFNARTTNVLAMWRDFFYNPYFESVNPLLDNNILDYILTLKPENRINRKFFISHFNHYYSDLGAKRRISNNISNTELLSSINHNRNNFEKLIHSKYFLTNDLSQKCFTNKTLFSEFFDETRSVFLNKILNNKKNTSSTSTSSLLLRIMLTSQLFKNFKISASDYEI